MQARSPSSRSRPISRPITAPSTEPTMIAAVLYRDFKRVRDDNLIVVVKTSEI